MGLHQMDERMNELHRVIHIRQMSRPITRIINDQSSMMVTAIDIPSRCLTSFNLTCSVTTKLTHVTEVSVETAWRELQLFHQSVAKYNLALEELCKRTMLNGTGPLNAVQRQSDR